MLRPVSPSVCVLASDWLPCVVQQNLLTMEQILTVEETQIKDKKCILLRIKGGKQFVLQCEVSHAPIPTGHQTGMLQILSVFRAYQIKCGPHTQKKMMCVCVHVLCVLV